jgi:hypothetical protein
MFVGRNPFTINQALPQNSPSELDNSATIDFWLKDQPAGKVKIEVTDLAGTRKFTTEVDGHAGINRFFWRLRFDPTEEDRRRAEERLAQIRAQLAGGEEGGGFGGAFRAQGTEAGAGTYRVRLTAGGRTVEGTIMVRDDPDATGAGR